MNKAYTSAFNLAIKKATSFIKNPARLTKLTMEAINKLSHNKTSIHSIKDDLSTLIRLTKSWTSGNYKNINNSSIVTVIAAILYFVNPFDLIPDFVPFFGYTDDATILFYVLNQLGDEVERFKIWESNSNIE